MKKILILCGILTLYSSAILLYGQQASAFKKVYVEAGAGASANEGSFSKFGIQTVFSKRWTASMSYHSLQMSPKNLPYDYDPGYSTILFLPFPQSKPTVAMHLLNLTTGKFLPAGKKTWFTTEAGISFVNGEKAAFTRAVADQTGADPLGLLFGIISSDANYTVTKEKETTIGGSLKVDFNWAFTPFGGLGAGAFANFNSIQPTSGFEIKLILGWMNYPKTNKTK